MLANAETKSANANAHDMPPASAMHIKGAKVEVRVNAISNSYPAPMLGVVG